MVADARASSVPCSNRMAEAVAGASANSQALPTLKTSSSSSILTIPPVRRITFIELAEQVVDRKLVLKEANQVINPKLLELADSKSGGYGRHRGGRNRWRSRGGRNGKDRSYSRSRSRSYSREYNGRGNRRSYSRSYSRSRSPVSNRTEVIGKSYWSSER